MPKIKVHEDDLPPVGDLWHFEIGWDEDKESYIFLVQSSWNSNTNIPSYRKSVTLPSVGSNLEIAKIFQQIVDELTK